MSLFTSTHFASASATGTDWRDTSKNVLEKLDDIRTSGDAFNFGFLYISDHLAQDTTSIFNLFKSVLKIDDWIGSVGIGVIATDTAITDTPAISAMIGNFPEDSFCIFPREEEDDSEEKESDAQKPVKDWIEANTPMLTIVHGDPAAETDPRETLATLERTTNAFLVGGLTSSRSQHYQIANSIYENAMSGAFFADHVPVSTTISQGCAPIGKSHIITKVDDTIILELDDNRALETLQEDLALFTGAQLDKDPDDFDGDLKDVRKSDDLPEEFKTLFKGQIHVATSVSRSDQNDYLVRNISRLDVDEGSITISDAPSVGDRIFFVERNPKTIKADLSRNLVNLRKRVQHERGSFEPKAALYISCVARGMADKGAGAKEEIALIRDIIGTIPMTGFHASGEISNARLHGYTGILTLFF